jgi:hypothetical protein
MDTMGYFPWGKAAGCEVDHSPPSSADVKNGGAIPPLTNASSGLVLNNMIKYRDKVKTVKLSL